MTAHSNKRRGLTILEFLEKRGRSNKWNMLGKPLQPGDLELFLGARFDGATRARYARALENLMRSGLIESDFADTASPGDWVELGPRGRQALGSGALDTLDEALMEISPRLLEMRAGIADALASEGPDSLRHAVDSAWELVSQALRLAVNDDDVRKMEWFNPTADAESGVTRDDRARLAMERKFGAFDDDACRMLGASARRLAKLKHTRIELERGQVELAIRQAEDALRGVLLPPSQQGVD